MNASSAASHEPPPDYRACLRVICDDSGDFSHSLSNGMGAPLEDV